MTAQVFKTFCSAFGQSTYLVSWTKPFRHCKLWLHQNADDGSISTVHDRLQASRFTREEVNTILMAIQGTKYWNVGGENSYPQIDEVA